MRLGPTARHMATRSADVEVEEESGWVRGWVVLLPSVNQRGASWGQPRHLMGKARNR